MLKKCIISRYDETISEPPFLTIQIDEIEVIQPEIDYLGEKFCEILKQACLAKKYILRFYTNSENKKYDYEIVVY